MPCYLRVVAERAFVHPIALDLLIFYGLVLSFDKLLENLVVGDPVFADSLELGQGLGLVLIDKGQFSVELKNILFVGTFDIVSKGHLMGFCLEGLEHACEEVTNFRDTLVQFLEVAPKVNLT